MRKIRTDEAWLAYFSGRYTKKEMEEITMNTPAVKEAIEFEDTFLQDKIERRAYEQREKAIRDYYYYINAYKVEGLEEGLKQGIQQGLKQGIQQGLEQGLEKTAINLLKMGIDISIIAKGTGLDIEKVNELQKSL